MSTESTNASYSDYIFRSGNTTDSIPVDRLNREPLAAQLALTLCHQGKEPLVLAISGEWGSGKSWVIARVRELLNKSTVQEQSSDSSEKRPYCIEFKPWEWSGTDSLVTQFFDQLGEAVQKVTEEPTKESAFTQFLIRWHLKPKKSLTHERLNAYAAWLTAHATVIGGYNKLILGLSGFSALLAVSEWFREPDWFPLVTSALLAAIAFLSGLTVWISDVFSKQAEATKKFSEANKKSPRALKTELITSLEKLPRPILVVMDDLDRLTADEVASVFQLVKAQADFPNVYYLLAFDRHLVSVALERVAPGVPGNGLPKNSGHKFLEKIVPVIFDLPSIEPARLKDILCRDLEEILHISLRDSPRWNDLWENGLNQFFRSIRDVERFVNCLQFNALLLGGKEIEVDALDLAVVETLRLFEPNVVERLAQSCDLVTKSSPDRDIKRRTVEMTRGQEAALKWDEREKEILKEHLYAMALNSEGTRLLLRHLFPDIEEFLRANGESRILPWRAYPSYAPRISNPTFFSRFFRYSIGPDEWSQSEVTELMKKAEDSAAFTEHIQSIIDGKLAPRQQNEMLSSRESNDSSAIVRKNWRRATELCNLVGQRIFHSPEGLCCMNAKSGRDLS